MRDSDLLRTLNSTLYVDNKIIWAIITTFWVDWGSHCSPFEVAFDPELKKYCPATEHFRRKSKSRNALNNVNRYSKYITGTVRYRYTSLNKFFSRYIFVSFRM